MRRFLCALTVLTVAFSAARLATGQTKSSRDKLAGLGGLIGVWNGTGLPSGTREEQQKGFWTETISCEWQFKGADAWLKLTFDKGKHFVSGEIRPSGDGFEVHLKTTGKEMQHFRGTLKDKVLTVERADFESKDEHKLVFTMLHENRILYRHDVRPAGKGLFYRKYQVGATKEGVAFAVGDGRPECIVSGGLGTSTVSYMGMTYYVCCSGCRTEFLDNPKKYVDEYNAKLKKKAK